jgi:hypothetical protein
MRDELVVVPAVLIRNRKPDQGAVEIGHFVKTVQPADIRRLLEVGDCAYYVYFPSPMATRMVNKVITGPPREIWTGPLYVQGLDDDWGAIDKVRKVWKAAGWTFLPNQYMLEQARLVAELVVDASLLKTISGSTLQGPTEWYRSSRDKPAELPPDPVQLELVVNCHFVTTSIGGIPNNDRLLGKFVKMLDWSAELPRPYSQAPGEFGCPAGLYMLEDVIQRGKADVSCNLTPVYINEPFDNQLKAAWLAFRARGWTLELEENEIALARLLNGIAEAEKFRL